MLGRRVLLILRLLIVASHFAFVPHAAAIWPLSSIWPFAKKQTQIIVPPDLPTISEDGILYRRPFPKGKLWVIGDVHGGSEALREILRNIGAIDYDNNWIGGEAGVVLAGDLIDRGPDSRGVMDLAMMLQKQAEAAGGFFESVLGNHETMAATGATSYTTPDDERAFAEFDGGNPGTRAIRNALRGKTQYAEWIASRNTFLHVGHVTIVHAGLGPWIESHSTGRINTLVRQWVRHFQGNAPAPPAETKWVVEGRSNGPLWTPSFGDEALRPSWPAFSKRRVFSWLDRFLYSQYMVNGHMTTKDRKINKDKHRFSPRVIGVDTEINNLERGTLSAVMFSHEGAPPKAFHFPRIDSCERYFKKTAANESH